MHKISIDPNTAALWRRRLAAAFHWLRTRELATVLSLLVLVAGTWGFIELADEVIEGDTHAFDERVMRTLRDAGGDPIGPAWVPRALRDITSLGGFPVLTLVVLAVAGFLLLVRHYSAMWLVIAASITGLVSGHLLKAYFDRPRPDLEHLDDVVSASFPSGHAMMSAIVYLTLGVLLANFVQRRRLKTYFIVTALTLAACIGMTRVYLGVHYPTDVLAGWTAGLAWAVLCGLVANVLKTTRWWRRHRHIEEE